MSIKKGLPRTAIHGYFRKPVRTITISDTSRNLVPFIQFSKLEKHPWRSVTFSKVPYTLPWVFFTFSKLCKMVPNHTKRLIIVATFFYTELSGWMLLVYFILWSFWLVSALPPALRVLFNTYMRSFKRLMYVQLTSCVKGVYLNTPW